MKTVSQIKIIVNIYVIYFFNYLIIIKKLAFSPLLYYTHIINLLRSLKMKKIFLLIMTAILLLTALSCSKGEKKEKKNYNAEGVTAFENGDFDGAIEHKYCHECGSLEHQKHPTDTGLLAMSEEQLIEKANALVDLYYSFTWDDFSFPKAWGIEEEEGYFLVSDWTPDGGYDCYVAEYVSYDGEHDYYWFLETETFKAERLLGENAALRYENVIGDGGYPSSYEGRLYDITGKDITDIFIKDMVPIRVLKATNMSASEYHERLRESFSGKALDDVENTGRWLTEVNGDLYRAPYLGAKGYAWVEIIYESAEIISRDEHSFTVRYNHNCVDPVFMKESTWHFAIENGRILLRDFEEVYDYQVS